MKTTISVLEIKPDILSAKTLALVSEFALVLYRKNGTIIDVHSEDVIFRVFDNAYKVTDPRLQEICNEVRAELARKCTALSSVPHDVLPSRAPIDRPRLHRKL